MDFEAFIQQAESTPFWAYNNIKVESAERDCGIVYVDLTDEGKNLAGFAHGGLLFTLADAAGGITARSDGRMYATQSCSAQFIKNTNAGRLRAIGTVLSRGRMVCNVDVKVYDDQERLLFHGTYSFFCTSK